MCILNNKDSGRLHARKKGFEAGNPVFKNETSIIDNNTKRAIHIADIGQKIAIRLGADLNEDVSCFYASTLWINVNPNYFLSERTALLMKLKTATVLHTNLKDSAGSVSVWCEAPFVHHKILHPLGAYVALVGHEKVDKSWRTHSLPQPRGFSPTSRISRGSRSL